MNLKNTVFGIVCVGTVILIITLVIRINALTNTNIQVSNELARKDSLHRILLNETTSLSERYANQTKDFDAILAHNSVLAEYLHKNKYKVTSLTKKVEELKLENVKLKADSINYYKPDSGDLCVETAMFDTIDNYFSMIGFYNAIPEPSFTMVSLNVIDSSFIGAAEYNKDFIKGFISHSNPYIKEKSAEFYFPIQHKVIDSTFPYYLALGTLVLGIFVGAQF